jgi:deoxyguanosine kinase
MIKLIVLEGARGGGKSSVAKILRDTLPSSTLINFTGFKEDGDAGMTKVYCYYRSWCSMLERLADEQHEYVFICDRLFFSEMIYSKLYKSYDFSHYFKSLLALIATNPNIETNVFFLRLDEDDVKERLNRDKKDHFAKYESVEQIMDQQETYKGVFDYCRDFKKMMGRMAARLYIHEINTTNYVPGEVADEIIIHSR